MVKAWIDKVVTDKVNELFKQKFDLYVHETKMDMRRADVKGEIYDEMRLARGKEYVVLETETMEPETIEGWFDLTDLAQGDQVAIEFWIKIKDIGWKRWSSEERFDQQPNPAMRLSNLLAPSGAKIVLRHKAGKPYKVAWYLRRLA